MTSQVCTLQKCYVKKCDTQTDERLKEWKTLDKRSVQLIPANGKQSDNKGQTSSATVMSRSGKLSEHLLASTKPREMETQEQLVNDTCRCRLCQVHSPKYQ